MIGWEVQVYTQADSLRTDMARRIGESTQGWQSLPRGNDDCSGK